MTIVDVHCHTFNADDLPVKGFVKAVGGSRHKLVKVLGWSLAKITQGMATGAQELRDLDRLIERGPGLEAADESALNRADDLADELLAELQEDDKELADDAAREAATDPGSTAGDGPGLESMHDRAEELRRYLKWVALFGDGRLALTRALQKLYPQVDLFIPLLVDFQRLGDEPKTTTLEQLQLQERISRLGILGHFRAQVHPFVGFDPRRVGAVQLAQRAVEEFGCVGVKLYPPIGFLPLGNVDHRPERMSEEEAPGVERALAELYTWCQAEQVPITAHSNASNYASRSFVHNSGPQHWAKVLKRWPELHLNLGHFGWAGDDWPEQIADLMGHYPHLYADIGNHELSVLPKTINRLAGLFDDPRTKTARERFMFGTDWFMVASHHRFPHFLIEIRDAYEDRFPDDLAAFMGDTALRFLGFDDPSNANAGRLAARYAAYEAEKPDWLKA